MERVQLRRVRFHLHTALRAHRRVGLSTDNWGWYWVQLMGTLPLPPPSIMQRGQAKFITTEPAPPDGQRSSSASLRSYYFGLQGVFASHFWTEASVPDDPPKHSNSVKHIE